VRRKSHELGVFEGLRSFFGKKKKTGLPAIPLAPLHAAFGPPALRPEAAPGGMLEFFRPSVPAPAPAKEPPGFFETLIPAAEPEPEGSLFEAFAPAGPMAREASAFHPGRAAGGIEDWARAYPDIAAGTGGRIPLWIIHDYGWRIPSVDEIADNIPGALNLDALFDEVFGMTETPWWREQVQEAPHYGRPAEYTIFRVGDIVSFMNLPPPLADAYADEPFGGDYLLEDILIPYIKRFTRAMDILKPRELKGWFDLEREDGELYLFYKEAPQRASPA
jgi:hypothetical protein